MFLTAIVLIGVMDTNITLLRNRKRTEGEYL